MDNFNPAEPSPAKKKNYWPTHPVSPASRIIGIVMVLASLTWLYLSIDIWDNELNRLKSMVNYKDPELAFVNPEELTGGLALIGTLQGFAAIVFCLGVYRIIFSRKSSWLVFAVFPLAFGAIIAQALYVNSVREDTKEAVLVNQHEWAEQRYGITYDEITVREIKGRNENRSYTVQDSVMKDGQIIATVCERHERQSTLFCEPGTDTELLTFITDSSLDSSYEYTEEDYENFIKNNEPMPGWIEYNE